jgi:hypothetical protein
LEWYRQALAIRQDDVTSKAAVAECLVTSGNYPEGRACALEAERDSTDRALQCVARYLVMVSYALERNVTGSEKYFRHFLDHFTAQSPGQPSVGNWVYSGLINAINNSGVTHETKFVLLTLIDLQLGKLLCSELTFFAVQAYKTTPNVEATSASFTRV